MDMNKMPLFSLMGRRMGWLTQRHSVLAHNIANSDTPNYVPRDLSKNSFKQMVTGQNATRASVVRTAENHIQPANSSSQDYRARKADDTYETALGGNAVILEEQLMKVSETQGAYNLVTNLYNKHMGMLKMAIGRNQG